MMSAFEDRAFNHQRMKELYAFVERLMFHSVLQDELVLPALSKLQLLLGAVVLSQAKLAFAVQDRILAAMVFMHHGLALHETVSDGTNPQVKKDQLTILGGDFLSSMFYRLLAETGRIDLIKGFSQAVVDINRAKASLYESLQDHNYDETDYLADVRTVHGALLDALCKAFPPDEKTQAFVQAALQARVYEGELDKGQDWSDRSLANIMLRAVVTPEEQRHMLSVATSAAPSDTRLLSLHTKYGTITRVFQGLYEAMEQLRQRTVEMIGPEGWLQVRELFHSNSVSGDGVPVGEGG